MKNLYISTELLKELFTVVVTKRLAIFSVPFPPQKVPNVFFQFIFFATKTSRSVPPHISLAVILLVNTQIHK